MQALGGTGKSASIRDGREGAEMTKVHHAQIITNLH
jgi:hypothetical protein